MKTNNEIVKGLECCSVHPMKCKECPYQGEDCCTNAHRKDALNFIKYLMGEVEKYKKKADSLMWDLPPMGGFHDD